MQATKNDPLQLTISTEAPSPDSAVKQAQVPAPVGTNLEIA